MASPQDHNSLVAQFCGITAATPEEAENYLVSSDWSLEDAAAQYYASQEGGADAEGGVLAPAAYTGPRTLDGRPAPESRTRVPTAASSSRPGRQVPRTGIATLGSLAGGSGSHAGHGHDDDDDDDSDYQDEDEQPRDLFAGGEKSGLAVQDPTRRDPRSLVNDILKKARSQAPRPGAEPTPAPPSRFRGSGVTLGGEDTPSTIIPSATPPTAATAEPQRRVLHLWNDGFSIEDGPLHRFDDPQNAADLAVIRSGRAPVHLMNVSYDQPVDVQLNKHDTDYVKPKAVYKPFGGSGQRLGSPTPGSPVVATTPQGPRGLGQAAPAAPEVEIDSNQPTINLRLQLADGTRLPARFNTTHTIGDIYEFIERASPASATREWVLATTFPNKEHKDKSVVLGEMPEFKRGGTAVQKWV